MSPPSYNTPRLASVFALFVALHVTSALAAHSSTQYKPSGSSRTLEKPLSTESLLGFLTEASDTQIEASLKNAEELASGREAQPRLSPRLHGAALMALAAAHANSRSRFHDDPQLIPAMEQHVRLLLSIQNTSGLWSLGNIDSPPDSAFVLKTLAKAQLLLVRANSPSTISLRERLTVLILSATEGVRTGGVHTPNHRWAICSALAHVHYLYPNPDYLTRIEQWLAEGIDIDADGQFSERSSIYTSEVNLPALIDLALLLKRTELLAPVRRALDASRYLFETDGEVETAASRRQDQHPQSHRYAWEYYFAYRTLALIDANPTYTAIARWIENDFLDELALSADNMSSPLSALLVYPECQPELPSLPNSALKLHATDYTKVFTISSLARLKRGPFTATIYGGSDWHAGLGHGSGLATNPTFFKLRKGAAILESVRLSPHFFATGFFYSRGIEVSGSEYRLRQKIDIPYHHPLPHIHTRADGQYPLQADMGNQGILGRYFSQMDFANRPKDYVTLDSQVTVFEQGDGFDLVFDIKGPAGVPITIELSFREDGTLEGTTHSLNDSSQESPHLLKSGYARYSRGGDILSFGPGSYDAAPQPLEGESLTWVSGHMHTSGHHVYLTGKTPFRHTIQFR